MARTIKQKPYRPYSKEDKENRHKTHVRYRAKVRNQMAKGFLGWVATVKAEREAKEQK